MYSIVGNGGGANATIIVESATQPATGAVKVFQPMGSGEPQVIVDPKSYGGHMFDLMQATPDRELNRFADAYVEPEYNLYAKLSDVIPGMSHVNQNSNTDIQLIVG